MRTRRSSRAWATLALLVVGAVSVAGCVPPRGVWLAGDTHVHDDHSSDGSLPRQVSDQILPGNLPVGDQIAQAQRTGLDFLPLTDHRTYDQQWDPQWTSADVLLIPGEEANGSPHATVLGAVDELVDGANPPASAPQRHVQQSVWAVHAQDASWGTAHPDDGELDANGAPNANASVVGVDTVEVWNKASDPETEVDYAENRWNHGFRFGVAGASDDHFREVWSIAGPGQPTTWVFASARSERAILDALHAGHTVVSGSPTGVLATLEADLDGDRVYDAMGGDSVAASAGRHGTLRIRVQRGIGTRVLVYAAPGRSAGPIATLTPTAVDQRFVVPVVTGSAWYRVEVRGPGPLSGIGVRDPDPTNQLLAITSPVFVDIGGAPVLRPEIPVPPLSGLTDGARAVVATPHRFAGFPDVAVSGATAHVVAEVHDGGSTSVVYRRMTGSHDDRADTTAIDLAPAAHAARFPRVAASGRDVWVTWQDERSGQLPRRPDVFLRHSPDGGRTWQPEIRLTTGLGRAEHPVVALLDGRHPVVAWADNRTGAFDVLVQRVGIDTAPIDLAGTGKVIDPGLAGDARSPRFPASLFPAIAVSRLGRVAVAWTDDRNDPDPLWTGGTGVGDGTDPDDWEIFVSHLAENGQWSPPVNASGDPNGADRHPAITFDGHGGLVVAWDRKALQSSGANVSLAWTRSGDGGVTFAPAAPIAHDDDAMSQNPRLATTRRGRVRITWTDSRAADWRWSVWSAELSDSGVSAPVRVSGDGNATGPAISGTRVVFASDRDALAQRDRTQGVFLTSATRPARTRKR